MPTSSFPALPQCFALLDDATASAAQSRLYTGLLTSLQSTDAASWALMWQAVQQALTRGEFAVAILSYETGAALQAIAPHNAQQNTQQASRVLLFQHCHMLSKAEVDRWLAQQVDNAPAGVAHLRADSDAAQFAAAIAQIHAYIAAGDSYQVNYTYRLHFDAYGNPRKLFQRLRQRQPVPYGALICLPDGEAILSLSPELFVQHQAGKLSTKPMKGTAPASGDSREDQQRAEQLAQDPKNRAENLMIVDLLRNDLGRIAQAGSVKVSALFEVQRFADVLQMTSSIEAQLAPTNKLCDVISALYPCGSITGAPKHRTMQIIRELEPQTRGIYTGAIGWFDPTATPNQLADFCLSVPIRTLHLQAPDASQIRQGCMGVGAGIVHDSVAADEYAECQLKTQFLTGLAAEFELFETIYATHQDGARHLDRHLARLQQSAAYFGFPFDQAEIVRTIQALQADLPPQGAFRLRLTISSDGAIHLQSAPLLPLTLPSQVLITDQTTRSDDLFLRHKTSVRSHYDTAWKTAESQGAFDMLFFNEKGYLTEGGRSNVFIQLDGQWLTPPLSDGVLPGVMRAVLLEDATLSAIERSITLSELRRADKVMLCNALRGAFEVRIAD